MRRSKEQLLLRSSVTLRAVPTLLEVRSNNEAAPLRKSCSSRILPRTFCFSKIRVREISIKQTIVRMLPRDHRNRERGDDNQRNPYSIT